MPKTKSGPPGNRSEAIREALAANPKATSTEIVAKLAEKGLKVAPSLVYYVRSKQRHVKRKAHRESVAAAYRKSGSPNPLELVLRVKDLAREVGGIKNLKQLIDLLAE